MELHTENTAATWATPQCPFTIQYIPRVLDDIRLAVVDAFFSLPRGGAEIGGILLGSYSGGRLIIAGYEALDCEHAFGPGFTLSARDRARLAEMLAAGRPADLRPVGWYHSHTRSEIFLSDADLEIHNRYFPEPGQVALVIKPHTFKPARAGFFFREAGGEIHATASHLEFQLEHLAVQPLPAAVPAPARFAGAPSRVEAAPPPNAITLAAAPVAEPAPPAPEAVPEPAPEAAVPDEPEAVPPPQFLKPAEGRSWRWLKVVAPVVVGLALGSLGYITWQAWLPQLLTRLGRQQKGPAAAAAPAPLPPAPVALGLNVLDADGQLQIRWDRNSPAVRTAGNALLEILDAGSPPRAVPLDQEHLQSGSFTYARQGDRVDVVLIIDHPNGKVARESTAFLGKAPAGKEDVDALRQQRDEAIQRSDKLESDLKAARDDNRKLQRSLADERQLLRIRQRLANQVPK